MEIDGRGRYYTLDVIIKCIETSTHSMSTYKRNIYRSQVCVTCIYRVHRYMLSPLAVAWGLANPG